MDVREDLGRELAFLSRENWERIQRGRGGTFAGDLAEKKHLSAKKSTLIIKQGQMQKKLIVFPHAKKKGKGNWVHPHNHGKEKIELKRKRGKTGMEGWSIKKTLWAWGKDVGRGRQ